MYAFGAINILSALLLIASYNFAMLYFNFIQFDVLISLEIFLIGPWII